MRGEAFAAEANSGRHQTTNLPSIRWRSVGRIAAVFAGVICALTWAMPAKASTLARAPVAIGQFAVNPAGAATYSIPIQFVNGLVPGGGGLTPHLSLDYSSSGGNGVWYTESSSGNGYWGFGWRLSGLSVIKTCNGNNNNLLCLDDQPLVATSGAYGANGTVYQTQFDPTAKIVSYGGNGTTPAYFKVWTKSGLIMELGNTVDSRGYVCCTWGVDKVSDVKGNYYTVTYGSDSSHTYQDLFPTQISYGGNTTRNLSPNKTLTISYTYLNCPTCAGPQTITIMPSFQSLPYIISLSDNPLIWQANNVPRSRVTSVLIPGASMQGRVAFTYQGGYFNTYTWAGQTQLTISHYFDWMTSATQVSIRRGPRIWVLWRVCGMDRGAGDRRSG